MFTLVHPQIEAAKFGDNRSNTVYIFKHPTIHGRIERIPQTAVLLIGPVHQPLLELLQSRSRHHFQRDILPLSDKAHHYLHQALLHNEPGEIGRPHQVGDNGDLIHVLTGEHTGRIHLLFGHQRPGEWVQAMPASILLAGVHTGRLRGILLADGQALKRQMSLGNGTYQRLREFVGLESPQGRPRRLEAEGAG